MGCRGLGEVVANRIVGGTLVDIGNLFGGGEPASLHCRCIPCGVGTFKAGKTEAKLRGKSVNSGVGGFYKIVYFSKQCVGKAGNHQIKLAHPRKVLGGVHVLNGLQGRGKLGRRGG
jgi:hypothetical protein